MQVNKLSAWRALENEAAQLREERIDSLFENEPQRLDYLSLEAAGLYVDFSKNLITKAVFSHLLTLANERQLSQAIESMFRGEVVNTTENRPALHCLLRDKFAHSPDPVQSERIQQIADARRRIDEFSEQVWRGDIVGFGGKRISDIVNIGIGGSHLGPQLVCDALRYEHRDGLNVHFVSNVDGGDLHRVLDKLDPESTYFIVASKSFSTAETLLNASTACTWVQDRFNDQRAVQAHFSAVTSSPERAVAFGISEHNILPMWDWVGGRYSLWSAIGLPIAIAIGADGFDRLLCGAEQMDKHFQTAPLHKNIPVMLALISIWNNNFRGCETLAVIPYDDRLRHLPEYLQQLEMESNGKRMTLENEVPDFTTSPVIWGGVGSNAQHAFFQQLHQGTRNGAIDFIVSLTHQRATRQHQDMLVANCIAQAEGLMRGTRSSPLSNATSVDADIDLTAHRECPGNRPSTLLVINKLTPESLGALLALYEHRTFVQGVIWNINSFDQWGVELGKELANSILEELGSADRGTHDPSTSAILQRYRRARKETG